MDVVKVIIAAKGTLREEDTIKGVNDSQNLTFLYYISELPTIHQISFPSFDNQAFNPEVRDFTRRQEIIQRLRTIFAPQAFVSLPIYDGQNLLFVHTPVQEGSYLVSVFSDTAVPNARGTYTVDIARTGAAPIRPSDLLGLIHPSTQQTSDTTTEIARATNLLQLLLKQDVNQKYPHNARAFFMQEQRRRVGRGLEFWRGYFYSVRPTIGRMMINVDTTMAAVYQEGPLVQLCMDFLEASGDVRRALNLTPSSENFRKLERFVKNLKIIVTTRNKTKVIRGLHPDADGYTFTSSGGQQLTVGQYMRQAYAIDLRYRGIVGARLSGAQADRPEIVPLELCLVKSGQLFRKKLPPALTDSARQFATLTPGDRMSHIRSSGTSPISQFIESEYVVQARMSISRAPLEIQGKLLDLPDIRFGSGGKLAPSEGSWNVVRQKLHTPRALQAWAVISFVDRLFMEEIQRYARSLADCCFSLGLFPGGQYSRTEFQSVPDYLSVDREPRPPITIRLGNGQDPENGLKGVYEDVISRIVDPKKLNELMPYLVILVILPEKAEPLRNRVKHWSDVIMGVRTQCVRIDKLKKANNQYYNNVALKLNARLGGQNFIVESPAMKWFGERPTMVMGADVSHPGPGVQRPSVASLVWSYNREATRYCALTSVQDPRTEHILDLRQMANRAIDHFGNINGQKGPDGKMKQTMPRRIVFFRDGLSEGEYEGVAQQEIRALRDIWESHKAHVDLTYVVVGKRHHVAFFPDPDTNAHDGKGNAMAGFVADRDLCSPLAADFYLQSHAAILGTSRSSHYIVMLDQCDLRRDRLEELAFSLCHVYAKATRSVSIPAPVYYADLACDRLKFHISHDSEVHFSDNSSFGGEEEVFDLERWKRAYRHVNDRVNQTMYFL
ncbi:hypothetical protein VNI00_005887 [Paramarasmius palmivorus]|uniref:Piwi domain-containing protein n=1 Tax=Paramarasmius palmivorus TaxID=297713 RepID=A0AAW0DE65_9AGAR